jgi:hypothetical protein
MIYDCVLHNLHSLLIPDFPNQTTEEIEENKLPASVLG